jgi:hypothetical protein
MVVLIYNHPPAPLLQKEGEYESTVNLGDKSLFLDDSCLLYFTLLYFTYVYFIFTSFEVKCYQKATGGPYR